MRVDTIQLIGDGTYILRSFRDFYFRRFFDAHRQGMTVHVGRQIVETVGKVKYLRISEFFAQFFYSSMDISAMDIYFLYIFSVQRCAKVHHTVCRRMLRAYIDYVIVVFKYFYLLLFQALRSFHDAWRNIYNLFAGKVYRIQRGTVVIVFAKRKSYPVAIEEEAAHVGVVDKTYAEQCVHLALVEMGCFPKVGYGIQQRIGTICHPGLNGYLHRHILGRGQQIEDT